MGPIFPQERKKRKIRIKGKAVQSRPCHGTTDWMIGAIADYCLIAGVELVARIEQVDQRGDGAAEAVGVTHSKPVPAMASCHWRRMLFGERNGSATERYTGSWDSAKFGKQRSSQCGCGEVCGDLTERCRPGVHGGNDLCLIESVGERV